MTKKIIGFILLALVVLCGVLAVRASRLGTGPGTVPRATIAVDERVVADHLAGAVRFNTVSETAGAADPAAFRALQAYLEQTYPLVHQHLKREVVNDLSLLYVWTGRDPAKAPVVLMGHTDVVPVIPGTESRWTHPAFEGVVDGGFVWGRGTLDDKSTVMAALEGVERALADGYTPSRTVVLAFGHDEEIGGRNGAVKLLERYKALGFPPPALVLDEGGFIGEKMIPGVDEPTAMIGISEKGILSVRLSVEGEGGHSSVPPAVTHIGRIARAVTALEAEQLPASLDKPGQAMLEALAPTMPWSRRLVMANLWLFGPAVAKAMVSVPTTASAVRTTTAPTVFRAGSKENVLPPTAEAVVNFRIRPGETVSSVMEHVKKVVNDPEVKIESYGAGGDPPPISDPNSPAFAFVATTIRQTLGRTAPIVVPFVCPGATDARYWSALSPNVYRFNPFPFDKDAQTRAHGTDERMAVSAFADGVRFYVQLLKGLDLLP